MRNLISAPWTIINDGVMGGRSEAQTEVLEDLMRFSGTLSLANNGGFSSIRRNLEETPGGYSGVRMDARGDGRRYQLRLHQEESAVPVSWSAAFSTTQHWRTITIPFGAFEPVFRGNKVPEAGPVDPAKVHQMGFLIGDKQAGAFTLEVRKLHFYPD